MANAQFPQLFNFSNDTLYGANPYGSLILEGNFLYGTTNAGDINDMGTVFKIKPDGTGFSKLHDFGSILNDGNNPLGSLFSDGTFLYGMTNSGGANGKGNIFKIKPDGKGFADLFDFNGANGSAPRSSLISDGTFLYGTTEGDGINNKGTIFKINPTGLGVADYTAAIDFTVYPNPTGGVLNLKMNHSSSDGVQMTIYTIYGECIYQHIGKSSNLQTDLSSQPQGIYFLQLKSEKGTTTKKIIIQK